jgi:hypothetical protein
MGPEGIEPLPEKAIDLAMSARPDEAGALA